jgi:hypothetical protein
MDMLQHNPGSDDAFFESPGRHSNLRIELLHVCVQGQDLQHEFAPHDELPVAWFLSGNLSRSLMAMAALTMEATLTL